MSELTKEQFEELPDYAKAAFAQDGEVFIPAKDAKLKSTLNDVDSKYKGVAAELERYKAQEAEKLEAARKEAYDKAIAEGNSEEISKRHAEQLDDAIARAREEGRLEENKKNLAYLANEKADKNATLFAAEIAVDNFATELLQREIMSHTEITEENEIIYLDDLGSAVSSFDVFKKDFLKNPKYSRLLKAGLITTGGGKVNGSSGSSAPTKKPSEMSTQERIEFKQRDPSGFKAAFNLN